MKSDFLQKKFARRFGSILVIATVWSTGPLSTFYARDLKAEADIDPSQPLDFPINGLGDEFSPSLSLDGRLFFSARPMDASARDIYSVRLYDDGLKLPQSLSQINSSYEDVTPFITTNGTIMVFASNRPGSIPCASAGSAEQELRCGQPDPDNGSKPVRSYDIYWSVMIQGKWSDPRPVPGAVNTPGDETNPTMNIAGDTLYFTHLPQEAGSVTEIRSAKFDGKRFYDVQPLSEIINSGYGEMALFPAEDADGFFFASRRPGGFGGWDIYFVHYRAGYFGVPVNPGPGVNSKADETQPFKMGNVLYYASNRSGDYDLYRTGSYILDYQLSFRFVEESTGKPVDAEVKLRAGSNNRTGVYFAQSRFQTDEQGRIQMYVHPSLRRLQLTVTDKDYLPVFQDVYVPHVALREMVIELKAIRKNESFDIHAIHFDFNSAKIRPESLDYLDSMAEYMNNNTDIRFEIIGHTDLKGSASYNKRLSLKRATAVRDYLVEKGISRERFSVSGMGESEPLVNKEGKGFDEKNRRTEFRVLDDGKKEGARGTGEDD